MCHVEDRGADRGKRVYDTRERHPRRSVGTEGQAYAFPRSIGYPHAGKERFGGVVHCRAPERRVGRERVERLADVAVVRPEIGGVVGFAICTETLLAPVATSRDRATPPAGRLSDSGDTFDGVLPRCAATYGEAVRCSMTIPNPPDPDPCMEQNSMSLLTERSISWRVIVREVTLSVHGGGDGGGNQFYPGRARFELDGISVAVGVMGV